VSEGKTLAIRGKEETGDYRYFPEPDLLPVVIDDAWINRIGSRLPELPDPKKKRFMEAYGLSDYDTNILTRNRDLADYFESCQRRTKDPKMVANWVINELLRELRKDGREVGECPVGSDNLADMILLVKEGTISGKMAKDVFQEMYGTGKDARTIVNTMGGQVTNEGAIARVVLQVMEENPEQVEKYKAGKEKLLGFFVGEVMKKTKGKANPQIVNEILKRELLGQE
jgi:aspartyl-tRNA(Asn)/glutamyl-tRNA(Gln) amidotransferase subunit B